MPQREASGLEKIWQTERLLLDGDRFFEALLHDIDRAKTSVCLETYIYRGDVTGQRVAQTLIRAAKRGVKVRLIVDGIGASGWYEKHAPLMESQGVATRVYHPILFSNLWSRVKIDLGVVSHHRKIRGSALLSRLNRRDHRKMCVIDGQIGYAGSVNITDDHCASIVGERAWRDTSVRVEGGAILDLSVAFDDVWDRCHDANAKPRWKERLLKPKAPRFFSRFVRFNYTGKLRKKTYRQLLRRMTRSKKRIWITNPYFAPSLSLLRALKKAAANGADVRVLVPRHSDVFFMPWVATAYYSIVMKNGGRIYEYLPRMLHAKTAIIDQWMTVGSSNFNRRSLVNDFEVDLVLSHPPTLAELVATFEKDLKEAEQVTATRGGLTAWVGRLISLLLKNWI